MPSAMELKAPDRPKANVSATFSHDDDGRGILVIKSNVNLLVGNSQTANPTETACDLNSAIGYICKLVDSNVVPTPGSAHVIMQVEAVDGVVEARAEGTNGLAVKLEPESSHAPIIEAFCESLRARGYKVSLKEYSFAARR